MTASDSMYNVAFRNTKECKGYAGVITWSSFKDKAEFDEWYTGDIKRRQEVVEEGITEERAIQLCDQTPIESDLLACLQEATEPDGTLNKHILEMKLKTVMFARGPERFKQYFEQSEKIDEEFK